MSEPREILLVVAVVLFAVATLGWSPRGANLAAAAGGFFALAFLVG